MIDIELLNELERASESIGGVARLPVEQADDFVRDLAERFVADPSAARWWEALNRDATRVPYGDRDGLELVGGWLNPRSIVRLVATDEQNPPWPVYEGETEKIVAMLRECRFFEFLLAPKELDWVMFDTHSNEIICVGLTRES